ncbi:FAD-dependent monooxygenase [Gloeobacter kilaueensis]|uniref:FAD-binding monooxygenase, PheA/TfdB n=1 Tax=Gloeobacter kilaueensis (strain ATCC BAA-2537 / CCAP 1431/1 / ULC 316 / JS1) TaxID=1183438 RepID=U5QPV5_GLOK1|nr:FAD-dependent monooxygenase [Gloeobacter kilaueensis]AGY59725.1 FAD-binding monooxygenase, PheA/TfdB [Gloeobacter kilaueensis JS1]
MNRQSTQVVVVGGSLVGLSASVFLASRDVEHVVIEKHKGSSLLPRAMGFTEYTMECYRSVGLWDRIPQSDPGVRLRRRKVESLAGEWKEETLWTPGEIDDQRGRFSPATGAAIPQDKLEPVLRARAVELGAQLRLGHEMIGFTELGEGIEVHVSDRDSGEEYVVEASYMIAADGARSPIREKLGIERQGVGYLQTIRTTLFYCPDAEVYLKSGVQQFDIDQPGFQALLTTYQDGRWMLLMGDGEAVSSPDQQHAAVRRALGADFPFEIVASGRWELAGRIADTYQHSRIFLAGDAAHQLPPTRGGFGANTGIADVYNLAWKLDMVLRGLATEELLKTYNSERQPIGWLRHQQTFARPDYVKFTGKAMEDVTLYGDVAMELGQLYRSSAVIGAGPNLPPAKTPEAWAGQPGVRAPHAWVIYKGKRISTIDLFNRDFVLLSRDPVWREAAKQASVALEISIQAVIVGEDVLFESAQDFERLFGLKHGGGSLVRPDGVVCWRTEERVDRSDNVLIEVVAKVASAKRSASGRRN